MRRTWCCGRWVPDLNRSEGKKKSWVFGQAQYYRRAAFKEALGSEMREVWIAAAYAWLETARSMNSGFHRLCEKEA